MNYADESDDEVYYVDDSEEDSECGEVQQTEYAESVPSNPTPPAKIQSFNPTKNGVTLQYTLDGEPILLPLDSSRRSPAFARFGSKRWLGRPSPLHGLRRDLRL